MPHFTYSCPLRWADMDANGHMNNAVYSVYLEDTRFHMFAELVPEDPTERLSSNFVVSEQALKFRSPLVYREAPVTVHAWVEEVRGVSFTLRCEIKDDANVYVEARTVLVGYDSNAGRPRRFSEHEKDVLTSYAA
ncbi:acyl-CoA thioesterase [Streptomyces sp. NPDC050485]|uniref:acyl-CoA thioesterase n=1 Tax=Streptomyces sp. NPDC050485 TaxID=3365617 RepID=UPI00379B60CE